MWSDEVKKTCSLLHKSENVCGQKMPKYANLICESSLTLIGMSYESKKNAHL